MLATHVEKNSHRLDADHDNGVGAPPRYGEIWGDMGRYGETMTMESVRLRDMGRYGEIWGALPTRRGAGEALAKPSLGVGLLSGAPRHPHEHARPISPHISPYLPISQVLLGIRTNMLAGGARIDPSRRNRER